MMNSHTAALRRITQPAAQTELLEWFRSLSERYAENNAQRNNGRAWRAELKRMQIPYGVMMCEGYNALRQRMNAHMSLGPLEQMALALFVCAAVPSKNPAFIIAFPSGEPSTP